MKFSGNRRRLIQAGSSVAVVGALGSIAGRSHAQANTLRVAVYGGDVGKANIEAYVKPFEAETGIKVEAVTDQVSEAQLEVMVNTQSVSADVITLGQMTVLTAQAKGLVEPIDYSLHKKAELDGLYGYAKHSHGVANFVYGYVMGYNTTRYPAGKPRPTTWAEYWDVQKFPGTRSLVSGRQGGEGPWEEALLADGVLLDKIYPMDIDRIFKSLDRIKPHVRKWWTMGSEIQQMMTDKSVDLFQTYDGRAAIVSDRGGAVDITRNQSKLTWDYWAIPKGAANLRNAQRFLEFVSRADRQAAFAQRVSFGPVNANAFKLMPDAVGRKLASHPEFQSNSLRINAGWYAERGSDGLSNNERLRARWNEWILS